MAADVIVVLHRVEGGAGCLEILNASSGDGRLEGALSLKGVAAVGIIEHKNNMEDGTFAQVRIARIRPIHLPAHEPGHRSRSTTARHSLLDTRRRSRASSPAVCRMASFRS